MKTIELSEFTADYLTISSNLTRSECRLLYIYITDSDVINLSQSRIAVRIGVDRRTIIIGIKKLKQFGYVSDINITIPENSRKMTHSNSDSGIKKTDREKAEEFIIQAFTSRCKPNRYGRKIVGRELYDHVIGISDLAYEFRLNREFLTETIKENFPEWTFYWQKDKTQLIPKERENIRSTIKDYVRILNKKNNRNSFPRKILKDIVESNDTSKEKVLKVIEEEFPNLVMDDKKIWLSKTSKK